MNKLHITLLFTFLFSCFAMSAKDEIVGYGVDNFQDGVDLFVYYPITKDNDGYWVWVEYTYTTSDARKWHASTQTVIWSEKRLIVYSHNWRKSAVASNISYDKDGRVVERYDFDLDFSYIVPGSVGEVEMKHFRSIYNKLQKRK